MPLHTPAMDKPSHPIADGRPELARFGAQVRLGFMLMLALCAALLVHTS